MSTAPLPKKISQPPDAAAMTIEQELLDVGYLVQAAISRATTALLNLDRALAQSVISGDNRIDHKEVDLELRVVDRLEREHPSSQALRELIATLKINNDLERMGDLAVNIAKSVVQLSDVERFRRVAGFEKLIELAEKMVARVLQALAQRDTRLARDVLEDETKMRRAQRAVQSAVEIETERVPEKTAILLDLAFISRQLERLGDYATNVAENIIYLVEGEIIRHRPRHRS